MDKAKKGLIIESILEIIVATSLIIISIPIWNNLELNDYRETAEYYSSEEFQNISYEDTQN